MENISPFLLSLVGNIIVAIGIIISIVITKFIKNKLHNYLEYITATTVGLLLGIIFLGFLPEITTEGNIIGKQLGIFILLGIFIFYLLELFLHWHHCKDLGDGKNSQSHNHDEHKNGLLIFGGTILHNTFHGVVLFSAFSLDFHFGIATTIAVLLHSIPQNIVNYIMNHKNIKFAYIAAFGGILGALLIFPFSDFLVENESYILAIISGGLLYTALADIFPEFNGKGTTSKKLAYFLFIIIGIFSFFFFEYISHSNHEHEYSHEESHDEILKH